MLCIGYNSIAQQSGWTLKRSFEYASVMVNLETREAEITWN